MKTILTALSFFLLSSVAGLHAQDRMPSPADQLSLQKGEVDYFQQMLHRFETALHEQDPDSAAALHEVLVELMDREVKNGQANPALTPSQTTNTKQKDELLQAFQKWEYSAREAEKGADQPKKFLQLMRDDLTTAGQ